jgi:hypothetical protein
VALVPKLNRGFITDGGGSGSIIIFDLKTYAVLGRIATMPDSDGLIYDPSTDLVLAVSGDGNSLMTFHPDVNPTNGKVNTIAHHSIDPMSVSELKRIVLARIADLEMLNNLNTQTSKPNYWSRWCHHRRQWPIADGRAPATCFEC